MAAHSFLTVVTSPWPPPSSPSSTTVRWGGELDTAWCMEGDKLRMDLVASAPPLLYLLRPPYSSRRVSSVQIGTGDKGTPAAQQASDPSAPPSTLSDGETEKGSDETETGPNPASSLTPSPTPPLPCWLPLNLNDTNWGDGSRSFKTAVFFVLFLVTIIM